MSEQKQKPWYEPPNSWVVMQLLVERKTVSPEHLPNLALSSMTGTELAAADTAVKTLLGLKQYFGRAHRHALEALANDIRIEDEERTEISMSPLFVDGRPPDEDNPPPAA